MDFEVVAVDLCLPLIRAKSEHENLGSEDPSYIKIVACHASDELKFPLAISSLLQIS